MLSIIVSSYQPHYFAQLSTNIKETIGDHFSYEIIQIQNPNLMGICEAYNKGAEKAQYDNLIFLHEDILFETNNWGNSILKYLLKPKTGVVGISGTNIKTKFPIAWWDIKQGYSSNIDQLDNSKKWVKRRSDSVVSKAIILDGVFLAVTKSKWMGNPFSHDNKSFHGYDVEFCLDISCHYQNIAINDILIKHYSQGNGDLSWFNELIRIYSKRKWTYPKNRKEFILLEIDYFCKYMNSYDFNFYKKCCTFFNFFSPLDYSVKDNYRIIKKFIYYLKK